MLEVSSLRSPTTADPFVGDHVVFPTTSGGADCCDAFMVDDNLLDYIDFSCDVPFFDTDGDILPDLEVDPTELLAEFSSIPPDDDPALSPAAGDGEAKPPERDSLRTRAQENHHKDEKQRLWEQAGGGKDFVAATCKNREDQGSSAVTTDDSAGATGSGSDSKSSPSAEGHSKKKAAAAAGKNSHGKRKVKVDWTPELHRRFVQAVEQLGIDKAVPSRILEIMGMDGLTRHNIASHLQKYRSHRKHLMAREAEAATWAHKRHMYAATRNKDAHAHAARPPWVLPTIGFPPPPPATPAPAPFCRPLHVWGHPPPGAVEAAAPAAMLPVWPRHLRPLPPWAPLVDPAAYWHQHQQYNNAAARKWSPHPQAAAAAAAGTPCVPPPAAMAVQPHMPRFPVPGMVPHPMYRPPTTMTMVPTPPPPPPQQQQQTCSKLAELQLQLDAHPSKESIDAAIGDVLVKPWLPLPLGLKPPSLDSVMSELHRHGIPNIPPAAAGSAAAG